MVTKQFKEIRSCDYRRVIISSAESPQVFRNFGGEISEWELLLGVELKAMHSFIAKKTGCRVYLQRYNE